VQILRPALCLFFATIATPVFPQQVAIHVVSDRPGGVLWAADTRTPLGDLPLLLRVSPPTPWVSCASLGEFSVHWADLLN
jgi:hypothetical protein